MTPTQPAQAAPRKRWALRIVLLVVAIIVVLLVAAELIARAALPALAATKIRDALDLPADQQIDVGVSGLLLPQILGGRLDDVTLHSDDVPLGDLTGDVDVDAQGVALSGDAFSSAVATIRLDDQQLATLLTNTPVPITRVVADPPNLVVYGEATVFGAALPLSLTVLPSAKDGGVLLDPVSLSVGGFDVDIADATQYLGDLGSLLTEPDPICIADRFPAGLQLSEVRTEKESLVIELAVDGGIVSDPALRALGSCG